MRRAVIATAGTVVALVALLDYKSSSGLHTSDVAVGASAGASAPATTTTPTTSPASGDTGGTAGSPGTTAPTSTAPTSTEPTTTVPAAASGSWTGTDVSYRYGTIAVQITVADGRITAITVPQETAQDPRSESINSQAVPILTAEALKAQGLNFDVVSGATYTSDAFAQSFSSALNKEKG
jgi:uncharacterized protein with FMN-binding domain